MSAEHEWWQKGIIYQIYPLSWKDTRGNGHGDLKGIQESLPYLKWLGVSAIWLSPIFDSPMIDYGYDVRDYKKINPLFGDMIEFEHLLRACHKVDIKLILDFVPNHTSDQHPWFLESRKDKRNPKRDWYIWKDGDVDEEAPNNWLSNFCGKAWTWEPETKQHYYHAFYPQQPDLNWRNPEVQDEMIDIMRFWLDKGVDGFRVDVIWHLVKDHHFRDNPRNPDYVPGKSPPYHALVPSYSTDQPDVHDIVSRMRSVIDEYHDRLLIGEIYLPISEIVNYYGYEHRRGVHFPYNFQLILLPWNAASVFAMINNYEASLPSFAWPNWVIGNHDKPRVASRLGPDQSKIAALLLLTLRGTPTLYYGDELGMTDIKLSFNDLRDPVGKTLPDQGLGRDPQRSPMQWNEEANAGFSSKTPWLPVAANYESVNVAAQQKQENSMLSFYHRLIHLRQREQALHLGEFYPVSQSDNAFSYLRTDGHKRFLITVNMSNSKERHTIPPRHAVRGRVLFSTYPRHEGKRVQNAMDLEPNEGWIAEVH